ncbi:uncharacterized protein LOC109708120 [Ananas comosus]|uniref:Uncharacterized protein LOC109708120 n=1 Tax=Ananas comosus TaxID=4615 RepID=A0A6P5EVL4_ANACO|nr:uncharacterized protein LOC109708120 [Ananas comosus]
MALARQSWASAMMAGLRRSMSTQNSASPRAPSPSKSPSRTMASASSAVIPSNPSTSRALRRRLSAVITPRPSSASTRNPARSSCMNSSASSRSAITAIRRKKRYREKNGVLPELHDDAADRVGAERAQTADFLPCLPLRLHLRKQVDQETAVGEEGDGADFQRRFRHEICSQNFSNVSEMPSWRSVFQTDANPICR